MTQYEYVPCRNLVVAIIERGIIDIQRGDPGARKWLHSKWFDHWCAWLDIDPDAARAAIAAQCPPEWIDITDAHIDAVAAHYAKGGRFVDAVTEVFGEHDKALYCRVQYWYKVRVGIIVRDKDRADFNTAPVEMSQ